MCSVWPDTVFFFFKKTLSPNVFRRSVHSLVHRKPHHPTTTPLWLDSAHIHVTWVALKAFDFALPAPVFSAKYSPFYSKMVQWRIGLIFLRNVNGSLSSIRLWKDSTPSEKSIPTLLYFIKPEPPGMLLWGKENPYLEKLLLSHLVVPQVCNLSSSFNSFSRVIGVLPFNLIYSLSMNHLFYLPLFLHSFTFPISLFSNSFAKEMPDDSNRHEDIVKNIWQYWVLLWTQ